MDVSGVAATGLINKANYIEEDDDTLTVGQPANCMVATR
jgi:hypothetical protein